MPDVGRSLLQLCLPMLVSRLVRALLQVLAPLPLSALSPQWWSGSWSLHALSRAFRILLSSLPPECELQPVAGTVRAVSFPTIDLPSWHWALIALELALDKSSRSISSTPAALTSNFPMHEQKLLQPIARSSALLVFVLPLTHRFSSTLPLILLSCSVGLMLQSLGSRNGLL